MKKIFTTAAGSIALPTTFRANLEKAFTNFCDTEFSEFADVDGFECTITFHTETACLTCSRHQETLRTFCVQISDAGKELSIDAIMADATSRKFANTIAKALQMSLAA